MKAGNARDISKLCMRACGRASTISCTASVPRLSFPANKQTPPNTPPVVTAWHMVPQPHQVIDGCITTTRLGCRTVATQTLHIHTHACPLRRQVRAPPNKQGVAYRQCRHLACARSQIERVPTHGHPQALGRTLPNAMATIPHNTTHENKQHNSATQGKHNKNDPAFLHTRANKNKKAPEWRRLFSTRQHTTAR